MDVNVTGFDKIIYVGGHTHDRAEIKQFISQNVNNEVIFIKGHVDNSLYDTIINVVNINSLSNILTFTPHDISECNKIDNN